MSFQRLGDPGRKKVPYRKLPAWDASIQDLTVHKATPEEIMSRKESHKSKNHMSVKLEKMKKDMQKKRMTGADAKQLAIMKEVLYDQQQLESVLAKSDTMMAVVKDIFGDDPKRFMGFPNVTTAPSEDNSINRSSSLVAHVPDIYTRTEQISDSIMDPSALNDVDYSDSDEDDPGDQPAPISYEPKMNLQRFQEFLLEEEKMSVQADPPTLMSQMASRQDQQVLKQRAKNQPTTGHPARGPGDPASTQSAKETSTNMQILASMLSQGGPDMSALTQDPRLMSLILASMAAEKNPPEPKTPPRQKSPTLPSDKTPPSAINDTQKIKRTKKQVRSEENNSISGMNTTANMSDMRKVLQDLESELAAYEHQTGRQPKGALGGGETFSGYTVALVDAVSRLTRYLKETDLRVRTEVTLREQLTQDVYQLRTIIDALATDLIVTQEEYGKLYSEHQRYKDGTQVELATIRKQIEELQSNVKQDNRQSATTPVNPASDPHSYQPLREEALQQQFRDSISKRSDDNKTSSPLPSQFGSSTQSGEYRPLPGHMTSTSTASTALTAIMLSPPVRRSRVCSDAGDADQAPVPASTRDPPWLTQAPPTMTSVSVPRPISLVQSNVALPLPPDPMTVGTLKSEARKPGSLLAGQKVTTSAVQENDLTELVRLGGETQAQLSQLKEIAVEEALNNPAMQTLMQTQIEDLNRQQEEARRRLKDLLHNQKFQQRTLEAQLGAVVEMGERHFGDTSGHSDVSPPISPISLQADRPVLRDSGNIPQAGQGRGITVSLPVADLDISGDSYSSPRLGRGKVKGSNIN